MGASSGPGGAASPVPAPQGGNGGNVGGNSNNQSTGYGSGGGGGAGAAGSNGTSFRAGNGGDGVQIPDIPTAFGENGYLLVVEQVVKPKMEAIKLVVPVVPVTVDFLYLSEMLHLVQVAVVLT